MFIQLVTEVIIFSSPSWFGLRYQWLEGEHIRFKQKITVVKGVTGSTLLRRWWEERTDHLRSSDTVSKLNSRKTSSFWERLWTGCFLRVVSTGVCIYAYPDLELNPQEAWIWGLVWVCYAQTWGCAVHPAFHRGLKALLGSVYSLSDLIWS